MALVADLLGRAMRDEEGEGDEEGGEELALLQQALLRAINAKKSNAQKKQAAILKVGGRAGVVQRIWSVGVWECGCLGEAACGGQDGLMH